MLCHGHLLREPLGCSRCSPQKASFHFLSAVFLERLVHVEGACGLQPAPARSLGSVVLSAPPCSACPSRGLCLIMQAVRFPGWCHLGASLGISSEAEFPSYDILHLHHELQFFLPAGQELELPFSSSSLLPSLGSPGPTWSLLPAVWCVLRRGAAGCCACRAVPAARGGTPCPGTPGAGHVGDMGHSVSAAWPAACRAVCPGGSGCWLRCAGLRPARCNSPGLGCGLLCSDIPQQCRAQLEQPVCLS